MREVSIVQRVLPHYRLPFFQRLHARLGQSGVRLTVYFGEAQPGTVPQTARTSEPWASPVRNTYLRVGSRQLVLQALPRSARTADLVIVEQALRVASSTALQARCLATGRRFAFWGHGRNYQARREDHAIEGVKRLLLCSCDWWFAYTAKSAREVVSAGFPQDRCTVVNNTIDTDELRAAVDLVTEEVRAGVRRELGLTGTALGVYCGGMYPDKRLAFLLSAIERVRARVPGFEAVFIGDGPDAGLVRAAAQRLPWVRYLGPVFGAERAKYLVTADLMLMPGLVGLAVVDAFVCETPLATTDCGLHSPEIEYLQHGQTGLISADDEASYAEMVAAHLCDPEALAHLRAGCRRAAEEITLSAMVDRFAGGIVDCQNRPRKGA